MEMKAHRFGSVALIAALFCGIKTLAQPPGPLAADGVGAEVQALRQAYIILSSADHDYDGHRIKAMHQIEDACDILGTDIRGDGKGHEPQGASDQQMRQAFQILEQAQTISQSQHQSDVAKHIREAIRQINLALNNK
jgi:hypothetical protein